MKKEMMVQEKTLSLGPKVEKVLKNMDQITQM